MNLDEIRSESRRITREIKIRMALQLGAILALTAFLAVACEEERVVGWNPATMRCQAFDGTTFVGPFLKDEECAGQPRPVEIQPEVQP